MELAIQPPTFPPRIAPALYAQGLRYQRRVERAVEALGLGATLHFGLWLAGPCQPDILVEFSSSILVLETKLSACDASAQLRKYAAALAPTGKRIWLVQVARNVSAQFPPTAPSLLDISSPLELVHWRL